jgi:DNA mismatch repair protein MutS2
MPIVPEKTRRELGWELLLEALVALSRTPVGRERTRALPFHETREAARAHLSRVAEARALTRLELEIPLADAPDARTHLARAAREGTLEPLALLDCARLVRAAARVRRFLGARRELAPQLAAEADALSEFEPLASEIERAIEPSGALKDEASAVLAELRERSRGLHRTIKARIDEFLRDPELETVLRDKYFSVRDDRYVLPVIASFKGKVPGTVHNASQSGQTLFIEPAALQELGNQLTIVQAMAHEEERRILQELTDAIGRRAAELERDLATLAELDRLNAAARFADRLDAVEPELAGPEEPLEFRALRHPLLVLRGVPVVANDVALVEGKKGLIVSGPNAGGKTVTLTAAGLSSLLALAGLPVPAASARIPFFAAVHTAIGDEGDLAKDLSTFTSHLTALRDISRATGPGTLVCIDEMAADTDPREGAAIASAMLEELADRGARIFLTTHLDELKAKGLTDPRFVSASVGFDFEKLAPTYRLTMNEAGASSAIEIAARVGLSDKVIERARQLLGGEGSSLSKAIAALAHERGETRRLEQVLREEKNRTSRARERWEQLNRALQAKERESAGKARREVLAELDAVRDEVRRTLASLQKASSVKLAVEAQQKLERLAREQEARARLEEAQALAIETREDAPAAALKAGARVKVPAIGREGEVLELDGAEAVVAVGPLKARVKVAELVPLTGRPKERDRAGFRRTKEERIARAAEAAPRAVDSGAGRADLRGMRTEDALRDLRSALDALFTSEARELTIVHGHGSGALKKAVREELTSSAYIQSFRPGEREEGGDGVTVALLKAR